MGYNLLIVDDSPSMRQVIQKTIRISGADVAQYFEAGNGQEALAVLAANWVDLVVTDLYMPVMDGFELLRRMRQDPLYQELPILVVSTESRESKLEELFALGVSGFIHKPFRPESIRDEIVRCLGVGEYERSTADSDDNDF